MKNAILVILLLILAVAAGGYLYTKNQKASQALPSEQQVTVQKTPTPTLSAEPKVSEIALTVTAPMSGSTVTSSKVTVKGKTLPKAEVYANEAEGVADAAGNFTLSVALDEGENSIIVTAVDVDGNVAETEVTVTYSVGQ